MNLKEKLYRFKYKYAPQLYLTKPVDVSLELSSRCQLSCNYCYFSDRKNLPFKQGFMSYILANLIIDQCAELGVNSIKFNWKGESTLNPIFESCTKKAKDYAIGSTFIDRLTNSNFNFKNDNESVFRGLANQTKVKISFDSFIPNVLEKQRNGSKYDLTISNINKFYNHPDRIKSETIMVIQAVRTLLNKDEDILGEAKKRWPEAQVSIRDMVAGRVEKDLSNMENKKRDTNIRKSCIQAHARLTVHIDGRVSACCPDLKGEINLGDANKESIYDIWNSDAAKQLRKELLSKKAFDKEPCKSCSSFESYGGYVHPWKS